MRRLKFFALLFFLLMAYGCIRDGKPEWAINAQIVEYTMKVGDEETLYLEVHPYYKTQNLIIESMNESVVVFEDGIIRAVGAGKTEIKVYLEDYPDECYIEISVIVTITDKQIPETVLEWIKTQIGTEVDEPKFFPTSHPQYAVEIEYESQNPDVLSDNGLPFKKEFDVEASVKITVRYNGYVATDVHDVVVVGYAFNSIYNYFFNQFPSFTRRILNDINVRMDTIYNAYPEAVVTWHSTDVSVFTNAGKYIQPINDKPFQIVLVVAFPDRGLERTYVENYTAAGLSVYDRAAIVQEWLEELKIVPAMIDTDLELPQIYQQEFTVTLEWSSDKPKIISDDGQISLPNKNELVTLTCKVISGQESAMIHFKTEVAGKGYEDKWEEIEAFLDEIFLDKIKTQRYTIAGVTASFYRYNYGYVPFYFNERSDVTQDLLPADHAFRPSPYQSYTRKYVVIHDTANNNPGAGVEMHSQFIKNPDRTASSWHYTVDDELIYQHIPDMEEAWHAGDGEGNRYGIGIETCINPEVDYTVVMQKTAKLTAELLYKYGLTLKDIRQHYDFTKKECPRVMRINKRWDEFIDLVSIEYSGISKFSDVEFVWESLSKNIMNDKGYVFNHPGVETTVTYKVKVTYNNETREYTHTSVLLPPAWS